MSSRAHSRLMCTSSVLCAYGDCLVCLLQAADGSSLDATSSEGIASSEGIPMDVADPRRGRRRRAGRVACSRLRMAVRARSSSSRRQRRCAWSCAGERRRCARAFSASRVMRVVALAWLRRGSVDGTATAVGKGWNAFRIEGRHFSTGHTLIPTPCTLSYAGAPPPPSTHHHMNQAPTIINK